MRDRIRPIGLIVGTVGVLGGGLPAISVPAGAALATVGTALVAGGVVLGRRLPVRLGGVATGTALLIATLTGAGPVPVLGGAIALLVGYDAARYGLSLDAELASDVGTRRIELVHATSTFAIATLTAGVGYGAYLAVRDLPGLAVIALFAGVAAFLVAATRGLRTGGSDPG